MHNESQESVDRSEDVRAGVEAADDTGMIAQQELLHVVGDAETGGEQRDAEGSDAERA